MRQRNHWFRLASAKRKCLAMPPLCSILKHQSPSKHANIQYPPPAPPLPKPPPPPDIRAGPIGQRPITPPTSALLPFPFCRSALSLLTWRACQNQAAAPQNVLEFCPFCSLWISEQGTGPQTNTAPRDRFPPLRWQELRKGHLQQRRLHQRLPPRHGLHGHWPWLLAHRIALARPEAAAPLAKAGKGSS